MGTKKLSKRISNTEPHHKEERVAATHKHDSSHSNDDALTDHQQLES